MECLGNAVLSREVALYYAKSEIGNEICNNCIKGFNLENIDNMDENTLKELVKTLSNCRKNNIFEVIYSQAQKFYFCKWKSSELELTDINSKVITELSKVKSKLEDFSEVVRKRELEILKEFEDNGRDIVNKKLIIRKLPNSMGGRVIDGCHRSVVLYLRGCKIFEGYTFFG